MLSPPEQWPSREVVAGDAPKLKSRRGNGQQVICILDWSHFGIHPAGPEITPHISVFGTVPHFVLARLFGSPGWNDQETLSNN